MGTGRRSRARAQPEARRGRPQGRSNSSKRTRAPMEAIGRRRGIEIELQHKRIVRDLRTDG